MTMEGVIVVLLVTIIAASRLWQWLHEEGGRNV